NHGIAEPRDPFSRAVEVEALEHGTLLNDESIIVNGIEIGGVDPRSWLKKRRSGFGESDVRLRILLCHFPRALERVPEGRWHLILAGHLHAGQINLPLGRRRRLMVAHPRSRYSHGVYRRGRTTM